MRGAPDRLSDAPVGARWHRQVLHLHMNSVARNIPSRPAVSTFDHSKSYWVAPDPAIGHLGWSSVPVPDTGTTIRVVSVSARDGFMQVLVNK